MRMFLLAMLAVLGLASAANAAGEPQANFYSSSNDPSFLMGGGG